MLKAVALVARELHQPLAAVEAMPLAKLFVWAQVAATFGGIEFED